MYLDISALSNGPINFTYLSHSGPETKDKKGGGTYTIYTFRLETTSNSLSGDYDIWQSSCEYGKAGKRLIDAKNGDTVQAFKSPDGQYVNWRLQPNISEPTTTQSAASENMRQIKAEKQVGEMVKDHDRSVVSRIVCVYMAAAITAGEDPEPAGAIARDAFDVQEKIVEDICGSLGL